MTIWDGAGIDTYDFSTYSSGVSIDLRPGRWVAIDDLAQRADLLAGAGEQWATGNIANALVYDGLNNTLANPDAGYIGMRPVARATTLSSET